LAVELLDNRVPQIPGVLMVRAVSATLNAQTLVARILQRARIGENEQPTEEELVEVWRSEEHGCLVVYYLLQCLVATDHLMRP
jgi:hypothetical protein